MWRDGDEHGQHERQWFAAGSVARTHCNRGAPHEHNSTDRRRHLHSCACFSGRSRNGVGETVRGQQLLLLQYHRWEDRLFHRPSTLRQPLPLHTLQHRGDPTRCATTAARSPMSRTRTAYGAAEALVESNTPTRTPWAATTANPSVPNTLRGVPEPSSSTSASSEPTAWATAPLPIAIFTTTRTSDDSVWQFQVPGSASSAEHTE